MVSTALGRHYTGVDLRPEQLEANERQAEVVRLRPVWVLGDACRPPDLVRGPFDMVLTCPPYADLERYSDRPDDLSTMRWPQFCDAYQQAISIAVSLLRQDRFAVYVVGDVRDRCGWHRSLPALTTAAFRAAGAGLYNEAVYIPPLGSLPTRAGRQFALSRKLGRAHQYVLVYCKGDPARAVKACGEISRIELA